MQHKLEVPLSARLVNGGWIRRWRGEPAKAPRPLVPRKCRIKQDCSSCTASSSGQE